MLKHIFKYNYLLIFAVVFAIPVCIVGAFVFNSLSYVDIVNNGIETIGYIIPDSYYSSTSVNDVSYYHVRYYYLDESGNTFDGQTSDAYLYSEVMAIVKEGTVKIKYKPDTHKSIEATYSFSNDPSLVGVMILFSVCIFAIQNPMMMCAMTNLFPTI
jgi:hypothetical protein